VYYVGYASDEDVGKYLARPKNFHILTFPHSWEKASSLFEIPVDFVSTCDARPFGDGYLFDLFVTSIPELQSKDQSPALGTYTRQRLRSLDIALLTHFSPPNQRRPIYPVIGEHNGRRRSPRVNPLTTPLHTLIIPYSGEILALAT